MRRPLIVAAIVFFFSSLVLSSAQITQGQHARFDWPDELSNAFFAQRIAAGEPLQAVDPDIARFGGRLHPRSTNVMGSALVPGGFLGLPFYYGIIASLVGFSATLFLTPLLAIAAAATLYFGLRHWLNPRHAAYAAILFLFHPAVWYFAAYAYLPNVPFLSLFICAIGVLLGIQSKRGRVADALGLLSGMAAGVALAFRPAEVLWAAPLLVVALWPHRSVRRRVVLWLGGCLVCLLPPLLLQYQVFGTVLAGYARFGDAPSMLPSEAVRGPLQWIFPFGIRPFYAAARFWDSFVAPFWWYTGFAAAGIALAGLAAVNEPSRRRRLFVRSMLIVSACVVGYLVLLYGSWKFVDAEIFAANTIGRSYVRYWLPIAALMAIAAAAPLSRAEGFPELRVRILGRVVTVALILLSAGMVFIRPNEALFAVRSRLVEYARLESRARSMDAVLDPGTVIITQRLDKVFFPYHRVLVPEGPVWNDAELLAIIKQFPEQQFVVADVMTPEQAAAFSEAMGQHNIMASEMPMENTIGIYQFWLSPLP